MSDVDRVRAFLHQAGAEGITQWQMHQPPDQAKPIERLAARVLDLRREGEDIRKYTEQVGRSRIARYVHGDYVAGTNNTSPQLALDEEKAA